MSWCYWQYTSEGAWEQGLPLEHHAYQWLWSAGHTAGTRGCAATEQCKVKLRQGRNGANRKKSTWPKVWTSSAVARWPGTQPLERTASTSELLNGDNYSDWHHSLLWGLNEPVDMLHLTKCLAHNRWSAQSYLFNASPELSWATSPQILLRYMHQRAKRLCFWGCIIKQAFLISPFCLSTSVSGQVNICLFVCLFDFDIFAFFNYNWHTILY